jgi:hypothetical protein
MQRNGEKAGEEREGNITHNESGGMGEAVRLRIIATIGRRGRRRGNREAQPIGQRE